MPLQRYEGEIQVVRRDEDVEAALEALRQEPVLGFDTESRPSFKKGVSYPPALMQFAGENRAYLFQLRLLSSPARLCELLAAETPLKVGVALHEDMRRLAELCEFQPRGVIELGDFSRKLGIVNTGLRSLAGIFLKIRISKSSQVSNWNRKELSESQIRYAATDAWVCLQIYKRLHDLGLASEFSRPHEKP